MEVAVPDLSRICGIAFNGESENNPIDVRDHQTFWLGAKTNLKGYNPTAPDAVLPALADISAYLYNDHNTDLLIKAALVHYQFEMIHPFERYNGIVGRILVPIILRDVIGGARHLICLSEYLYHNKNEYFDLLRTTQYSGGIFDGSSFLCMQWSKQLSSQQSCWHSTKMIYYGLNNG